MREIERESWLALRPAVLGVPAIFRAAVDSGPDACNARSRVGRIAHQLYADAVLELGEQEAEDVVGATLRLVRDRIIDIFGSAAWDEAARSEPW